MGRRFVVSSIGGAAAIAACGGSPKEPPLLPPPLPTASAPASPVPAVRDDGRLPVTVTPERYALSLRIDPAQPRFSGVTTIQVRVPEPTSYVVLNARDMNIAHARARVAGAEISATTTMRVAHGGFVPEELVLTFARPLPAGEAVLEIAYDAPFAADLSGLYRVKEGGADYAYTQFESTDARRAFPCFDEPAFKTAYDLTIISPRGLMAVANYPEATHEDAPDGMVAHRFETTRPLPSYLVAFAVGTFDVAEGQTAPFPIRVITTKGRAGLGRLALEDAEALIAKLGDYFGVRYPYAKLDLVAVPDFAAGAMENPGLVTFRDALLLLDPQRAAVGARREQALVIAHEFAHMWFGDLVTMKWWDDVWLNEGFATWAEAKMVDAWRPSFGATIDAITSVQSVMDTDALKSARAVRQPVRSTSEADEAFDGLTYEKGAAVLRMLEGWLGEDTFRRGVQRYIHDHAWGNATAEDLFHALDFVSTQKVGQLASDFLDHPGVPEVLVSWKCGAAPGGKLELRESEWRPLGAGGDPPRKWTVPVCVASDADKAKSCFTLGSEPIARDLGARCPNWLYPNAEQAGYYRFVIDKAQLLALAHGGRALPAADRLGLVSSTWAEVRQGAVAPAVLFELLPLFDGEANRNVIEEIANTLRGIDEALVEDGARPAFRKFVAARLAGHKASLGWEAKPKEDDDRALERATVLETMGEVAYDPATLAEAEKYAARWLKDPTSVPSDIAAVAVPLASIRATEARLDELRAAAKNAKTPEDHVLAIRAMGTFDDPTVLRHALDLVLSGELKLSEIVYLFRSALKQRTSSPVLYAWEKENWPKIREHTPGAVGKGVFVRVAKSLCTSSLRDDARAFFPTATQGMEAVDRPLQENLERSGLCVALHDHGAAEITEYFRHAGQAGAPAPLGPPRPQ